MLQRPARSVIAMEPKQRSVRLASIFKIRELNVLLALLIVGALISLATPYFLAVDNLMDVFPLIFVDRNHGDRHGYGHRHGRD